MSNAVPPTPVARNTGKKKRCDEGMTVTGEQSWIRALIGTSGLSSLVFSRFRVLLTVQPQD